MSFLMRSIVPFGALRASAPAKAVSARPETQRRKTIAVNAVVLIAAAALAMPIAIWLLVTQAAALPFVIATAGLAGGMVSLSLHQRQRFDEAALAQVA